MKIHTFRLQPGCDFRQEIDKYVKNHKILAGVILTCVGNFSKVILRMADAQITKEWSGSFEIVSIVGTVEVGNSHIHVSISDENGVTFGGHLKNETIIGVTAEVVIGEIPHTTFHREYDKQTGYDELIIKNGD